MAKIQQLSLSREQLLDAISVECQQMTAHQLSDLTIPVFGIKLNPCGSHRGQQFTTNLDNVKNRTLLRQSNTVDVEVKCMEIIKEAKLQSQSGEPAQALAKATLMLIEHGIYLSRKELQRAFEVA